MENNSGDKDKARSPQEETAKAAILAECGKLAKAGVTFVAVHFDGYGDDGASEEGGVSTANGMGTQRTKRTTMTPLICSNTLTPWSLLLMRTIAAGSGM